MTNFSHHAILITWQGKPIGTPNLPRLANRYSEPSLPTTTLRGIMKTPHLSQLPFQLLINEACSQVQHKVKKVQIPTLNQNEDTSDQAFANLLKEI